MSYSVRYDAPRSSLKKYTKPKKRLAVPLVLIFAVILIGSLVPAVGVWIQQIIFPGSGKDMLSILEQSIGAIRAGQPVAEAMYAFCAEILANG